MEQPRMNSVCFFLFCLTGPAEAAALAGAIISLLFLSCVHIHTRRVITIFGGNGKHLLSVDKPTYQFVTDLTPLVPLKGADRLRLTEIRDSFLFVFL
jgi:hypothetical protein